MYCASYKIEEMPISQEIYHIKLGIFMMYMGYNFPYVMAVELQHSRLVMSYV